MFVKLTYQKLYENWSLSWNLMWKDKKVSKMCIHYLKSEVPKKCYKCNKSLIAFTLKTHRKGFLLSMHKKHWLWFQGDYWVLLDVILIERKLIGAKLDLKQQCKRRKIGYEFEGNLWVLPNEMNG